MIQGDFQRNYYFGNGFFFDYAVRGYQLRERYRLYWSERRHNWNRERLVGDQTDRRYVGREVGL